MTFRALVILLCLLPWPDAATATAPGEPGKVPVPPNLLSVWVCKTRSDVPDAAADQLLAKALEIPGIQAAALVASLPERLHPSKESWILTIHGKAGTPPVRATPRLVSPGYFQMVDLRVVRGRALSDRDTMNSAPVAMVSMALAKRAWPEEDPIGKQISLSGDPYLSRLTVVGIVFDLAESKLQRAGELLIYLPIAQAQPIESFVLLVRTEDNPQQVEPPLREMIVRAFARELRLQSFEMISPAGE